MFDVPVWIQVFVIAGIALIVVAVPVRMIWEATRGSRDRRRKVDAFADRLRERFREVSVARSLFGSDRIRFKHKDRPITLFFPDEDEILVRLEVNISPKFPCVIRTKGGIEWPLAFEAMRPLRRIRTYESVLDDSVLIYSTPLFGAFLREAALDGIPREGKPKGVAESLVVLRRTPGVRWFRLMMSEPGGFRILFRMRTEDLMYRPDELEAVVHHAAQLYDALVLY